MNDTREQILAHAVAHPAPVTREQILAHATDLRHQAEQMLEMAESFAALADPETAQCDHETDSSTYRAYHDNGDGIAAYSGIERCDRCHAKRSVVVFPDATKAAGIQDIYYSDWVPNMTEIRRMTTLSDIVEQILSDAYRHAQADQAE